MEILVVIRNLYGNPDPFEDELILGDSDVNAISEACELRDLLGEESRVTALLFSQSESNYEAVLKKAISYGADGGIHASVDGFDFTDSNSFSRLMAEIIRKHFPVNNPPSLVMFGRLAYDGDSVNIATQLSVCLGFSRGIYSKRVWEINQDFLVFNKSLDGGNTAKIKVNLPAVLHSIRKEGLRRQARIQDIIKAYSSDITIESVAKETIDAALESARCAPSPGKGIQEIPPYSQAKDLTNLNGISDIETAGNIIATLKALGFEPR